MARTENKLLIVLGRRVHAFRTLMKLTQEALGNTVGVSQGEICRIEKGLSEPGITIVVAFTKVFGCTMDMLIDEKEHVQVELVFTRKGVRVNEPPPEDEE